MAKIVAIPKQFTDSQELAKITQDTLAITKKNDSELKDEEKLVLRNATKLNVQDFPLIFPVRATIGFMTRNMDGKNQQAIEFIRATLPQVNGRVNRTVQLVQEFDSLDEDSKSRVDCLDWLARKHKIPVLSLVGSLTEGITLFHNEMTKALIASKKPDIANKIFDSAEKESLKTSHHKKLAAQVAGLIDDKPLVSVDTGNKTINNTTNNQTVVLNFSDWQKQNDKVIRGQIGPSNDEVIEGEIVND